jgi:hypothetical protein
MRPINVWVIYMLASGVLMYLGYRNTDLLSATQKEERTRCLHEENSLSRWQNWSFLVVVISMVLLNWFGITSFPPLYFHFLVIFQTLYTVFRNRAIYLRLNLPKQFINREFILRICSVAVLVIFIFLNF